MDPVNQKPTDHYSRRDASLARMKAYRAEIGVAKDVLFDRKYGAENHFYLGLLATHPSFQRRGAGSALVRWGLDKAKRMGWTVTLFSSPMGESLVPICFFLLRKGMMRLLVI